jgi:nucleotide-binding universal stress UspA family protein
MDADRPFRMLVALDGGEAAESILAAIMPLVRLTRVDLELIRVVDQAEELPAARAYLDRTTAALSLHRVRAVTHLEGGEPAKVILNHLNSGRHDFGALATHGRRGLSRLIAGSVAEEVVRAAEIPLIVTRPGARIRDWTKILVPLDGSPEAETVLDDVEALAKATGASLHLLNIGHVAMAGPGMEFAFSAVTVPDLKPYLEDARRRLELRGLAATTEVRLGTPGPEIADVAAETGAGLIALTTHGRTGLRRVLMGSVAEAVFRTAPCPILVLPAARVSAALRRIGSEKPAAR